MAEIKNVPGPPAQRDQNTPGFRHNNVRRRCEQEWVKIPLHRDVVGQSVDGDGQGVGSGRQAGTADQVTSAVVLIQEEGQHRAAIKGNRLPQEAQMALIRKPKRPKWRPFLHVTFSAPQHESWRHFVDLAYWNVELSD